MKRHHLPALFTLGLLATIAVLELRNAYEEGRDCRERGGVIVESDASVESSPELKLCTADY
jgi:hypothetical protein